MILFTDDYSNADKEYIKELLLEAMDEDEITENDIYEQWIIDNQFDAEDFDYVLKSIDAEIENDIVAVGSLGLWDGRVQGYRTFDDLSDITQCCEDYNTFEIDRYKNLTLKAIHHDGANYVTFRELKSELSDTQIDNFLDKIYCGKATSKDITRYTKAIGHYFIERYWNGEW